RCVQRSRYGKTEYCLGDSSKRKNASSVLTLSNIRRAFSGLTPRRLAQHRRFPPEKYCPLPRALAGISASHRKDFGILIGITLVEVLKQDPAPLVVKVA